ncbi:MAG: septum formation initiator family protein [Acidimicrobiia bacterium]
MRKASSAPKPVSRRKPVRAAKPPTRKKRPAKKASSAPKAAHPGKRPRRRRTAVWLVLGSVVLVGLLFAFVYPTRTFLDQRDDTQRARTQLELLQRENTKLTAESKRLQQPDEVERRAREYGLVRPGEQAFVIVPAPTVATAPPARGTTTPSP